MRVHVARVQTPTVQLGEVKPTREHECLEVTKWVEHPGERASERAKPAVRESGRASLCMRRSGPIPTTNSRKREPDEGCQSET